MSNLQRVFLLIALLAVIGGASKPPLPAGGPPKDFLFVYTQESHDPESASRDGADTPSGQAPRKIRVAVDRDGLMEIEATYLVPHVVVENTSHSLPEEQFRALYDAILQADLLILQDEWEGADRDIGRETWFVLGNGKSRSISVVDVRVQDLSQLRSAVHICLPTLTHTTDAERDTVVMDTRTNVFHGADDPHVSEIPRKYRKVYGDPWAALNDGGQPCPLFRAKR